MVYPLDIQKHKLVELFADEDTVDIMGLLGHIA